MKIEIGTKKLTVDLTNGGEVEFSTFGNNHGKLTNTGNTNISVTEQYCYVNGLPNDYTLIPTETIKYNAQCGVYAQIFPNG